ncbi:MAG: C1 family peptidase [Bacteroidales bacterium]
MKRILSFTSILILVFSVFQLNAQEVKKDSANKKVYEFSIIKELPVTSVKNQFRSGTCWSFSALSFLESELLRVGKGEFDLSEMFTVYHSYLAKGDKYVRYHGNTAFPTGGASNDVIYVWRTVGIVPDTVFAGLNYGEPKHNHSEMDRLLSDFLASVVKGKELTPVWRNAYKGILDTYLGQAPTEFTYKGKKYTPRTYADELGLNPDDYIKITSFTHHPFYTSYIMDVSDNWNNGTAYNVPLDELQAIAENSIKQGYTMVWGGDVSEKGFSWKNGVAIIPDEENGDLKGTDRDKWESMSDKERKAEAYKFTKIVKEKEIDQVERQKGYDNYNSTDDHGMHLVGIVKDQNGTEYFKIKNSWDIDNPYQGYIYMSKPYFRSKTLDIMINKKALSAEMRKKLNVK